MSAITLKSSRGSIVSTADSDESLDTYSAINELLSDDDVDSAKPASRRISAVPAQLGLAPVQQSRASLMGTSEPLTRGHVADPLSWQKLDQDRFWDMMKNPVFVDYLNVFLNLPTFAQRAVYHFRTARFTFEPPVIFDETTGCDLPETKMASLGWWLLNQRSSIFLDSELYWEYCLCADLLAPEPFKDHTHFTALASNSFIIDNIGHVIGMRRFRHHLKGTAGERAIAVIRNIDRCCGCAKSSDSESAMSFSTVRTLCLSAALCNGGLFTNVSHEGGDYSAVKPLFEHLRSLLFFVVKVYWLPRFILRCSSRESRRHMLLEKEVMYCSRMVMGQLLLYPQLMAFEIIKECYDVVARHSGQLRSGSATNTGSDYVSSEVSAQNEEAGIVEAKQCQAAEDIPAAADDKGTNVITATSNAADNRAELLLGRAQRSASSSQMVGLTVSSHKELRATSQSSSFISIDAQVMKTHVTHIAALTSTNSHCIDEDAALESNRKSEQKMRSANGTSLPKILISGPETEQWLQQASSAKASSTPTALPSPAVASAHRGLSSRRSTSPTLQRSTGRLSEAGGSSLLASRSEKGQRRCHHSSVSHVIATASPISSPLVAAGATGLPADIMQRGQFESLIFRQESAASGTVLGSGRRSSHGFRASADADAALMAEAAACAKKPMEPTLPMTPQLSEIAEALRQKQADAFATAASDLGSGEQSSLQPPWRLAEHSSAPHIASWTYKIYHYDVDGEQSYRFVNRVYLMSLKSDIFGGRPFARWLRRLLRHHEASCMAFWADALHYLNDWESRQRTSAGSKQNVVSNGLCQPRYVLVQKLVTDYLLPTSAHQVTLPSHLAELLVLALQLDEAEELLKYCQDYVAEIIYPFWKAYMHWDREQFNNYLGLETVSATFELRNRALYIRAKKLAPQAKVTASLLQPQGLWMSACRRFVSSRASSLGTLPCIRFPARHCETASKKKTANNQSATEPTPDWLIMTETTAPAEEPTDTGATQNQVQERLMGMNEERMLLAHSLAADVANIPAIYVDFSEDVKYDEFQSGSLTLLQPDDFHKKVLSYAVRLKIGRSRKVKRAAAGSFPLTPSPLPSSATLSERSDTDQQSPKKPRCRLSIFRKFVNRTRSGSTTDAYDREAYMLPIIGRNGELLQRPLRKPRDIWAVLNDDVYRAFFMKFLVHHKREIPLKFWEAVHQKKTMPAKQHHAHDVDTLLKFFQRNDMFSALECSNPVMVQLRHTGTSNSSGLGLACMLDLAQEAVARSLESHWFQAFQDTFPIYRDSAEPASSRRRSLRLAKWRFWVRVIAGFYRGLKRRLTRRRFVQYVMQEYVKKEANARNSAQHGGSKATASVTGTQAHPQVPASSQQQQRPLTSLPGLAASSSTTSPAMPSQLNVCKQSPSALSSKTSLGPASLGAITSMLTGHSVKTRDKSKIPNDIQFLYEAIRFYHVARTVELNEAMMLLPRDDYVYMKQKAEAIVERFFESESPPKLQINISQALADGIIKAVKQNPRTTGLFFEVETHLLFPTLVIWNKYLTNTWTMGSLPAFGRSSRRRQPFSPRTTSGVTSPTKVKGQSQGERGSLSTLTPLLADGAQCEYVLMNSAGELEWTRIFFSIETGVRHYVVSAGSGSHALQDRLLRGGWTTGDRHRQPSLSAHTHGVTPSTAMLSSATARRRSSLAPESPAVASHSSDRAEEPPARGSCSTAIIEESPSTGEEDSL